MINSRLPLTDRYIGGDYIAENPSWHEEDSPWKARHIEALFQRNRIEPDSICEVGCGTGGIVDIIAKSHPLAEVEGFEIAPKAFEKCQKRESSNLRFTMGSPFETGRRFDICMAIDVIEHVENPFEFVRSMAGISNRQVFHIPLDMNALAVSRGWVIMEAREKVGHLHYFTRDTALALLRDSGLEVVDSFYTPWAIDQSQKTWKRQLAAYPRRIAFNLAQHATVRTIGGWSLMVLTQTV